MPEGNKCPHCNIDVIVFNKIVNLSDSLYNKGLAQAKASDLTGAASYLEKSVRINKDNVQAYNLLGLVKYEMGHIGDAVKNWVISTNRSPDNNPASGYIEELNRNSASW
jgi:tetratricopeptide (TPR) repeat protein